MFLSIFLLIFIFQMAGASVFLMFPYFARAQSDEPPASSGSRWTEQLCEETYKFMDKSYNPEEDWNEKKQVCYSPRVSMELQVPFGILESGNVDIVKYISGIYRYGIGVAGILAVAMIVFGGLRWLMAAGNPAQIGEAKESIASAVIGLLLALFSYVMLLTVNPNLVNLNFNRPEMVKPITMDEAICPDGKGSVKVGGKCSSTCDCVEGRCIEMEPGFTEVLTSGLVKTGMSVLSVWALGGGSLGTGAERLWFGVKQGTDVAKKMAQLCWSNKKICASTVTGGTAVYAVNSIVSSLKGEAAKEAQKEVPNGICIVEADHNVKQGDWCSKDEHCISGKCVMMKGYVALSGAAKGAKGLGVCAGKGVGSPCETSDDCEDGMWCVDNSDGQYTKSCTDGKSGSPCRTINDCQETGDPKSYECKSTGYGVPKKCMKKAESVSTDTPCKNDADCAYEGHAGEWTCALANGYCSQGKNFHACFVDTFEGDGIDKTKSCVEGVCAFYLDGKEVRFTGNEEDYEGNPSLLKVYKQIADHPGKTVRCVPNAISPSNY